MKGTSPSFFLLNLQKEYYYLEFADATSLGADRLELGTVDGGQWVEALRAKDKYRAGICNRLWRPEIDSARLNRLEESISWNRLLGSLNSTNSCSVTDMLG
jgi:hypothetical protein